MNHKAIAVAVAVITLSLPLLSHSHSNSDEVKVCYTFYGDELKQTQPCIVSTGGGAGGIYESIIINNKTHLFEGECSIDGNCTYAYYPNDPKGRKNPVEVISYLRDATFYHKVSEDESSLSNGLLYCYQTKNEDINICTN